jgi:hypothetical protein
VLWNQSLHPRVNDEIHDIRVRNVWAISHNTTMPDGHTARLPPRACSVPRVYVSPDPERQLQNPIAESVTVESDSAIANRIADPGSPVGPSEGVFTVYCPGGRPETAIALSYGKIANTYNCEIADPGSPILRVCKLLRCAGPSGRGRGLSRGRAGRLTADIPDRRYTSSSARRLLSAS